VVCGPSGVGKSKLAEVLTNRLNTPKPELNGQNPRRALLINTRPPDGELFHRTNFYQKGLTLLGKTTFDRHIKVDVATAEHLVEKKRARGKTTTRYPDDPEMRDVYEEELRRLRLRAVLLDEAQHLITSGDGKQPKDQLNWIKSMAIETGVLHVLIGTYDLLPFCNLDGQMARRGSEFHFARYHMEDENDCQAFRNAFPSLLKQIPLQVDHDTLIQRWWYFFEGSIGCIGILKQWLVRSLYRALREESPELTRAHLEQSVLPDAKWEQMPEVGKPNSSMLTGKTAICRNWRICQRSLPNNPILFLPRRRRPPIRRHVSRRDISTSHLPIEIKWEQCNRREKPPIVHSQDQSNWRQLVGWNRKSKKCNAQRAVR
jgi:AAA domain